MLGECGCGGDILGFIWKGVRDFRAHFYRGLKMGEISEPMHGEGGGRYPGQCVAGVRLRGGLGVGEYICAHVL